MNDKTNDKTISYKDAGVNVESGYAAVKMMKRHVASTQNENVLGGLGSFGGFYSLENINIQHPVLVSGTDGVGTKLKYAFALNKHDTIGIDAVAMCVNDVVCHGAQPLFFLDYIATGKLIPEVVADIVSGIADGCRQAGCAIIGGETAEMPGFYPQSEYDLAGFCVGIADREKIINGTGVQPGYKLIGFASSGLHSNGYSLVRRLIGESLDKLNEYNGDLQRTFGEELLIPTKIYVKTILELTKKFDISAIAHITGGGFIENIPRMLPNGIKAVINKGAWQVPPIFKILQSLGNMNDEMIYNTFNMGVGMVICVAPDIADEVCDYARRLGEDADIIGSTEEGSGISLK